MAHEMLTLTVSETDSAVVVHAAGEIDLATADLFRNNVETALELAGVHADMLIDLREVNFLGTVGLSVLLDAHTRGAANGTQLRLIATKTPVLRALQVSGLDRILQISSSLTPATQTH